MSRRQFYLHTAFNCSDLNYCQYDENALWRAELHGVGWIKLLPLKLILYLYNENSNYCDISPEGEWITPVRAVAHAICWARLWLVGIYIIANIPGRFCVRSWNARQMLSFSRCNKTTVCVYTTTILRRLLGRNYVMSSSLPGGILTKVQSVIFPASYLQPCILKKCLLPHTCFLLHHII